MDKRLVLIKKAVATITGCDSQWRANKDFDKSIKPLVLATGMLDAHGYTRDSIMATLGIEQKSSFNRLLRTYKEHLAEGAKKKGKEESQRTFRQAVLIQRYIEHHQDEYVETQAFLKY